MSHRWHRASWALLLASMTVAAVFWQTVHTMVDVWSHSRTFAHGFLVLPATGYMVWCYRDRLRALSPASHVMGPILVALLIFAWLLGRRNDTLLVQQIAVIAMLPALILACFGAEVFGALKWPLGFLGFALPVGTSIEPWLQKTTTLFIVTGLNVVGIPHQRDGFVITLPSRTWEVAPDCGGLRYLLPGLALGYVYTALLHHTPRQRVTFLLLCAVLLMVANGVRAYGIIVGDHFGMTEGTDHRVFSYTVYAWTVVSLGWVGLKWGDARGDRRGRICGACRAS